MRGFRRLRREHSERRGNTLATLASAGRRPDRCCHLADLVEREPLGHHRTPLLRTCSGEALARVRATGSDRAKSRGAWWFHAPQCRESADRSECVVEPVVRDLASKLHACLA
jgi:hypothetical protein